MQWQSRLRVDVGEQTSNPENEGSLSHATRGGFISPPLAKEQSVSVVTGRIRMHHNRPHFPVDE